jgi:hypothetical protein
MLALAAFLTSRWRSIAARRASDTEAATIEMCVDGLCICISQSKGWPHPICAPGRAA